MNATLFFIRESLKIRKAQRTPWLLYFREFPGMLREFLRLEREPVRMRPFFTHSTNPRKGGRKKKRK